MQIALINGILSLFAIVMAPFGRAAKPELTDIPNMKKRHDWKIRLEKAASETGRSLRDISLKAGLAHGYLHSILKTDRDPTIDNLISVCKEINVSLSYIMFGLELSAETEEISDTSSVMSNIHSEDPHKRRHFIPEWSEKCGKKQADIVRDLGIEKSTVYRWFAEGVIPTEKHLKPLAEYLQVDEVVALFRHPDDDWVAKMFRNKTEEQKEAAVQMLKLFFQLLESR